MVSIQSETFSKNGCVSFIIFFRGIDDEDENFYLYNGKGHKYYNRVNDTLVSLEEPNGFVLGYGPKKMSWYVFGEGEHMWRQTMIKIYRETGEKREIDLAKLFPDGRIWLMNFHPKNETMVFQMKTNLGLELFKVELNKPY